MIKMLLTVYIIHILCRSTLYILLLLNKPWPLSYSYQSLVAVVGDNDTFCNEVVVWVNYLWKCYVVINYALATPTRLYGIAFKYSYTLYSDPIDRV